MLTIRDIIGNTRVDRLGLRSAMFKQWKKAQDKCDMMQEGIRREEDDDKEG